MIPYMHFDVQFLEKFGVTFRREGETVTLKCTLLVTPELKRVQPRAEWYRDGEYEAGTAAPGGRRAPVTRLRTNGKLQGWSGGRAHHWDDRRRHGQQSILTPPRGRGQVSRDARI